MYLKKKNLVIQVTDEKKIEELKAQGYNEYERKENVKTSSYKRKKL